jgi:hypothetical protein
MDLFSKLQQKGGKSVAIYGIHEDDGAGRNVSTDSMKL